MNALFGDIQRIDPAWESYGCDVLNVFWLDDSHLEVQLHPQDKDCDGKEFPPREFLGVSVVTTRPASVLKRDAMKTSG